MNRRRLAVVAVATALLGARADVALAEPGPVLVAGFAADRAVRPADLPARLTSVMGRVVGREGHRVMAQGSRDDLLAIAGCPAPDAECLAGAIEMLAVERIVLGEVFPGEDGGVTVRLTRIDAGGAADQRDVELAADDAETMAAAFEPAATAFFRGEPAPEDAAAVDDTPDAPVLTAATSPADDHGGFSARRVEPWTWGVLGGGVVLAGVGAVLLSSAGGLQDEVDAAPTETAADLERLAELEGRGRARARWGGVLLVSGGAAAVVGAVLAFRQGRRTEPAGVALAPLIVEGGAGLSLAFGGGR